jgi:site-specific DNA-methyltransferase (adenine-specific)
VNVLKRLIEVFTDPGDVVIDPCCGSGSTLQAAYELGRNAYGFEVCKKFYDAARSEMPCFLDDPQTNLFEEVAHV